MPNPLILQIRTQLADLKQEKTELDLKIKRLYVELSQCLTPYYKKASQIKAEEIEQIGDELIKYKHNLQRLETDIEQLESELGV